MAIKPGSLHEPAHHQDPHEPNWWEMSESEIAARLMRREAGNMYDLAGGIEPPGFTYEWKTCSVNNMPDRDTIALAESNGWRSVPQMRHDGRWMTPGTDGPTIYQGQMLMEIPTPVYVVKKKLEKREADAQTAGLRDRMNYTPPGSAPRTQAELRRSAVAAGEYELSVER